MKQNKYKKINIVLRFEPEKFNMLKQAKLEASAKERLMLNWEDFVFLQVCGK